MVLLLYLVWSFWKADEFNTFKNILCCLPFFVFDVKYKSIIEQLFILASTSKYQYFFPDYFTKYKRIKLQKYFFLIINLNLKCGHAEELEEILWFHLSSFPIWVHFQVQDQSPIHHWNFFYSLSYCIIKKRNKCYAGDAMIFCIPPIINILCL